MEEYISLSEKINDVGKSVNAPDANDMGMITDLAQAMNLLDIQGVTNESIKRIDEVFLELDSYQKKYSQKWLTIKCLRNKS